MRYYYQKEFLGLAAWYSKANKQDRLVERGGGRVADICPKANLPPHWQAGSESFYRQGWGVTCRNSTIISNSHLQIDHQWSDQHHPACFRYNESSVLECTCSHFSAVSSQNCGNSSPEYSLVIMYLTSPPRILVSMRQLTGYSSEYYL